MTESLDNKPVISKQAGIISFIMIIIVGVLSNYIYCLSVYVEPLSQAYGWSMNTIWKFKKVYFFAISKKIYSQFLRESSKFAFKCTK